jgi:hypothetical protein
MKLKDWRGGAQIRQGDHTSLLDTTWRENEEGKNIGDTHTDTEREREREREVTSYPS